VIHPERGIALSATTQAVFRWCNAQLPATYIGNARTPTLIFDREEDTSNPVGQSKALYRALKHLGVETEMVLYPGEGHSPRNGSYNIDMFERILNWYDRFLKTAN
jgi:dipeptidyl aminopeptidase/acylaminoacyl peptidase